MAWAAIPDPPGLNTSFYPAGMQLFAPDNGHLWLAGQGWSLVQVYDTVARTWTTVATSTYLGTVGCFLYAGDLYSVDRDSFSLYINKVDLSTGAVTLLSTFDFFGATGAEVTGGGTSGSFYPAWAGFMNGKAWMLVAAQGLPPDFATPHTGLYMISWDLAAGTWTWDLFHDPGLYANWGAVADASTNCIFTVGGVLSNTNGGIDTGSPIADIRKYNPSDGSWNSVAMLPAANKLSAVVQQGRTMHIVSGYYSAPSGDPSVWWYDFNLDSHVLTQQPDVLAAMRSEASSAAVTPDGTLYFGGGFQTSDIGFWAHAPNLLRLPDESYAAEVRAEARLIPGIRMDGG